MQAARRAVSAAAWEPGVVLAVTMLLLLLGVLQATIACASPVSWVKRLPDGRYEYCAECGPSATADAWGTFDDTIEENGWSSLRIASNPSSQDEVAMYAAGYLEGALTWERIGQFNRSYRAHEFRKNPPTSALLSFIAAQDEYVLQQSSPGNWSDVYWYQVHLVLSQFRGLLDGYNAVAPAGQQLTRQDMLIINLIGDIDDIMKATNQSEQPDWAHMSPQQAADTTRQDLHCSVLVRVLPDNSDVYVAHTTWGSYPTMLRVFKTMDLPVRGAAARRMTFSSYPGVLTSDDDFFITDQRLAITETTNDVYNNTLWSRVVPRTVPYWIRSLVASRLATSAPQWMQLFGRENSGTYNNQWMVLDYKLFQPGSVLPDNLLWIGEQYPGAFPTMDVTSYLRLGVWPSYNVPFMQQTYDAMGYPAMYAKFGNDYSYSMCPRAQIFRRDAEKVTDNASLRRFMQYNDWMNDPLSGGTPDGAIAARTDLDPSDPKPVGGIDTKYVTGSMIDKMLVWALSGPTYEQQPAFSWDAWPDVPHDGQPTVFNFAWTLMDGGAPI